MAVATSRGMPWAAGRVASGRATKGVSVFSAKGLSASGLLGTSPLPQIGTLIAGTPYVYVRPRLTQNDLGGSGGSPYVSFAFPGGPSVRSMAQTADVVKRTNSQYAFYRERRRSPSIGVGAAGSMGVTMDVPFQSEVPYFSVA